MPFKFRLQGLAETFIDNISCPCCQNAGGESGEEGFRTDMTRVTLGGIIVVVQCEVCSHFFVPKDQRCGIINGPKLREAVEQDSVQTGEPVCHSRDSVLLDVEKLNAMMNNSLH